jgi:hypothetical protein
MTLVEISIYSSLLMMLMLAIYGTFAAAVKYFTVAQAQTDLQTAAQTAILHLVADVSESTSADVKVDTNPPGIIFVSPRDANGRFGSDNSGNILWQRWVCYYFDASAGTIVRSTLGISPTTSPPTNTYSTKYFQQLGSGRVIARNVTAFSIAGSKILDIAASFETTVNSNAAHTADTQLQIQDTFKLRN